MKHLENAGDLTLYDYGFLKGDTVMWSSWGAAMSVVSEFCRNKGYGNFGQPTESGKKAMKRYDECI